MERLLSNIEFFTNEGDIWFKRQEHPSIEKLCELDCDLIDELLEHIASFFPKAHDALHAEYRGCASNTLYYRYRIAARFIRCNLAIFDHIPDFSDTCHCSFEYVPCPLRGECRYENVICRPEFNSKLSAAEIPVLRLWFTGLSYELIADRLHLSPHTVHNHIRNAYERLDIHSRAEFVRYASQNNLFS